MLTASRKFRSDSNEFATRSSVWVLPFSVDKMTTLVFDLVRSLFGLALVAMLAVKLLWFITKVARPAVRWLTENREDGLRRMLVFLGFVVDEDE